MSHTDHNPFRDGEQPATSTTQPNLAPESPHVAFAARSPSIIPTPIYDDTSSIASSPINSPVPRIETIRENRAEASPSPLHNQIHRSPISPTTANAYQAKIEMDDNRSYGPTFRDDDGTQQYNASPIPDTYFHRGNFVPQTGEEEEIQLYENSTSQTKPLVHPPPEQSRVDIFMSKLKGYQKQSNSVDDGNNRENFASNSRGFNKPDDDELVRRSQKQRGLLFRQIFGSAKYPIFTWITTLVMLGVFIYELVRGHELSGSWIQTSPFNPMIGPNYMALINMGSKFDPCIRETTQFPPSSLLSNCYTTEAECSVEQACGFGGFGGQAPNQTFRFFTAIFLHAGVVHILFNLITHVQFGSEIERRLGLIRFIILYFVSGIWGFILSGVLSGLTMSSMGCSGSLFGLVGFSVTDIIMRWREVRRPQRELTILLVTAVISLAIGLFPGIDNFAHIGGFVMGLLFGVILTTLPDFASRRAIIISWIARVICLVLVVVLFVVFLRIFYTAPDLSSVCPGCKYLSCIPINDWCST